MAKYISLLTIFISLIIFNSCAEKSLSPAHSPVTAAIPSSLSASALVSSGKTASYGPYLAGRVAHLRKDFNKAADYYIIALQHDPDNAELLSRIYIILASQGRIPEAAKYAEASLKKGDSNNFTHIIMAVNAMKNKQYDQALKALDKMGSNPIYTGFITPLISSWIYAAQGNKDLAVKELSVLQKEPTLKSLYHLQAGMVYDYFNDEENARKNYEYIVNEESSEMSFRALQVITNFYIRHGQKDKAVALSRKYDDKRLFIDMLSNLADKNAAADPKKTKPIISSADIGMSEALFSIASNLRQVPSGIDIAHIFICLSIYTNPQYDVGRLLLADILESREMYSEAIAVYDEIPENSECYNAVQIKKAADYVMLQDYKAAEILLKALSKERLDNFQVNMDLGDVLRLRGKHDEAVGYYEKALSLMPEKNSDVWVVYYAMGISYEQSGNWEKAEAALKKALELSQNHYYVQNYLGYSWLRQGKNIDDAFTLIVDAYNQAPNDGHIADSLGWAFYRIGQYDNAVKYLEKASELEPANALINDHLGDAYWQAGRKTEAVFQWKHTLKMKDDSEEVDYDKIEQKIKSGLEAETPLAYDKSNIDKTASYLPKE